MENYRVPVNGKRDLVFPYAMTRRRSGKYRGGKQSPEVSVEIRPADKRYFTGFSVFPETER